MGVFAKCEQRNSVKVCEPVVGAEYVQVLFLLFLLQPLS